MMLTRRTNVILSRYNWDLIKAYKFGDIQYSRENWPSFIHRLATIIRIEVRLLKIHSETRKQIQIYPVMAFFPSSRHSRGKGTAVWLCYYEFVALSVQYFIGAYFILFLVMFTRNQLKLIVFGVYIG